MATGSSKIDQNFNSLLTAVSSADGETPERLEVDPLTGRLLVDITNAIITVVDDTVSTSTDVSLASSASSAQLLASNTSRKGLLLTNTDANTAYIYYGTTASLTKFSAKIPPGAYWEMPQPIYTGRIDAIWDVNGSGSLIGSEL